MSGGSFDYAYYKASTFADELKNKIDEHDKVNEWGEKPNEFSEPVLNKLAEIVVIVEHTSKLMKEVECLYSGDIGEDTFLTRLVEIEKSKP